MRLARRMPYPVKDYNILVSDVGLEVKSPSAEFRGKVGQGESRYLNYAGANLEEGTELVVELSGLGRVRPPAQGRGLSPALLIAVGLVVLALLGLFIAYPMLRRSARPGSPAARREQLLQELADLDDAFEQGLIEENEYTRRREAKKKQLMKLMRK